MASDPKSASTWADQEPSAAAVTVARSEPTVSMPTRLTSTVAPGGAVPLTVVAPATAWFATGAVIVTSAFAGGAWSTYRRVGVLGRAAFAPGGVIGPSAFAGGAWSTYRRVVMSGRSTIRPVERFTISRSSWACAQVSGAAEPAGWPSR